jgi:glyoxylase-like metal-dependent hydrolase (beta-lactamase superfamily II)
MNSSRGFAALALDVAILGHAQRLYPVLVWDSDSAVLVDTGYPGKEDALLALAKEALGDLDRIAAIVVTHQDIDHIGGGEGILARLGRPIPVYAHELDAPYIRGEKLLLKLASMRRREDAERLRGDEAGAFRDAVWGCRSRPEARNARRGLRRQGEPRSKRCQAEYD